MRYPFCPNTAPTPVPEASVSKVKGSEKSGKLSIGAVVMAFLSLWNAVSAYCS
ncbi:hypothetical protein A2U01_0068732, partial [Trifolium medium]|nr:hypothetical protein [Trifolium medium]